MLSREQKKEFSIEMRKKGDSYTAICATLNIPKSTLNYWLRNTNLSAKAKKVILNRKREAVKQNRAKALKVLREKYNRELKIINDAAQQDFKSYIMNDRDKELLLAMLYIGEGLKKTKSHIGLGNSDPKIELMFVRLLRELYNVDNSKLGCYLHLRMDQNEEKEKKYWSDILSIPVSMFNKSQFDSRTIDKPTWKSYHGVCVVCCNDHKIKKRLSEVQNIVFEKLLGD